MNLLIYYFFIINLFFGICRAETNKFFEIDKKSLLAVKIKEDLQGNIERGKKICISRKVNCLSCHEAPIIEEIEVKQEEQQEQEEEEDDEEIKQETQEAPQVQLPENIEKLVEFMHQTGGTLEDYVNLNKDYSNLNGEQLLKEYYNI